MARAFLTDNDKNKVVSLKDMTALSSGKIHFHSWRQKKIKIFI